MAKRKKQQLNPADYEAEISMKILQYGGIPGNPKQERFAVADLAQQKWLQGGYVCWFHETPRYWYSKRGVKQALNVYKQNYDYSGGFPDSWIVVRYLIDGGTEAYPADVFLEKA